MADVTQLHLLSPDDLKKIISDGIKAEIDVLKAHFEPKKPTEYLTRRQVAEIFTVDLSTINNWCKSRKLKPYGIGARVYFLRSDIEQTLQPLRA